MNTYGWLAWLSGALLIISSGRNPLYLALLLPAILIVYHVCLDRGGEAAIIFSPLRLALFMVVMAAAFNALTSHFGETALFSLPSGLPLLGGAVTMEALVYGATNGLALACLLTVFLTLNLALPTHDLIRLIPRAYYALAVVVSIAVAFLPSTRRQLTLALEAQAIRGRRTSGVRDFLGLFLPVLVGGMERAVQLAETMTARGFVSPSAGPAPRTEQALLLVGMGAAFAGWLLRNIGWPNLGSAGLGLAAFLVLIAVWRVGRKAPRSASRPIHWSIWDVAVALGAVGSAALLYLLPKIWEFGTLNYTPYPRFSLPAFSPLTALVMMSVLLPALAHQKDRS